MKGANVYLDVVSVGATMNIMMAAALADGLTTIENAAKEPHIVDLANFLNSMGADIKGAGTDTVRVHGCEKLSGGSYTIIPDQIEAGTYMAAAAVTGGDVIIRNIIPRHLECITAKLRVMGVKITEFDDSLRVQRTVPLRPTKVKTLPYPGFPTDMQPLLCVCMALAKGGSLITEGIYDTRFRYTAELNRMGANIQVDTKIAVINGVDGFHGCSVKAFDLRAGAAMVIAGLVASDTTVVEDVHYVERGYEDIVGKLQGLGATIKRIETPDGQKIQQVG